jgi:hypothetical protein
VVEHADGKCPRGVAPILCPAGFLIMGETLLKGPLSSAEPANTMAVETQPNRETSPEALQGHETSTQSLQNQMAALLEIGKTRGYLFLAECGKFLWRRKNAWLIAAGAILGVIAMVNLAGRLSDRFRNSRERRYDQAIASLTPERLIARCGQPAADATKEVFPILLRTMTYKRSGTPPFVLKFSRTAEEKSDWVYLAMQDESGARSYDAPDAQISALPCLDSKK